MAGKPNLINVRTWKRFNQLLVGALPIQSVDKLLTQLALAWLDIARAESAIVSVLRQDLKSLAVAHADRVGTHFKEIEAVTRIWDEETVLEIADAEAGYNTPSRFETFPIQSEHRFDGGVILESRDSKTLDKSALSEMTDLTVRLIEQALVLARLHIDAHSPDDHQTRSTSVVPVPIQSTRADSDSFPIAEPVVRDSNRQQPAQVVVQGISEEEFEGRLLAAKLEAMAEFAAGAGHEINNPIASISGRVELLLRTETNPERRQSLTSIGGQALRVRDMIGDAMLFARPPAPNRVSCDLNDAIEEVVQKLQESDIGRQSRFSANLQPGVIVHADPGQLRVVISSLIGNSLNAVRRDGHIQITSSMVQDQHGNQMAQFDITDNGIGLNEKDREHLFDPFYSGRQAGRGLGFGLSKCWRILQMHDGSIDVASDRGVTTFTFLWPATSHVRRKTSPNRTKPESDDRIAEGIIEDRLEDTGYKIPRRRRKRSY